MSSSSEVACNVMATPLSPAASPLRLAASLPPIKEMRESTVGSSMPKMGLKIRFCTTEVSSLATGLSFAGLSVSLNSYHLPSSFKPNMPFWAGSTTPSTFVMLKPCLLNSASISADVLLPLSVITRLYGKICS